MSMLRKFTARQRSCRKIMSSQASVKNSIDRGCTPPGQTPPWTETRQQTPPGRHHPPSGQPPPKAHPLDRHPLGQSQPLPPGQTRHQTATAADGKHPT